MCQALALAINAVPTDEPTPPGSAVNSELFSVATVLQDPPSPSAATPTSGSETPNALQLRIAVDGGVTSARVGATLTYAIIIQNLGTADVADLLVTQSLPAGLQFLSADSGGTVKPGSVSWKLDLKTTATATFHTTTTVLDTPPVLLRLATVVCAATSADASPTVCASDSDELPAGAAAEVSQAAAGQPAEAASSGSATWWYIAGAVVVFVGAIAAGLLTRRYRPRQAHGRGGP